MKLDDLTKLFESIKNNPTAIYGIAFTLLMGSGTAVYQGITKWNAATQVLENFDQVQNDAAESKRNFIALKERVDAQAESIMKAQEKASDALLAAREAKVVSESTQKEARASASATAIQLEVTSNTLKSEMNSIKRATTNRLGN